jgi:periplasmic divalent cation tolerance protein
MAIDVLQICTTVATEDDARALADTLVQARLAACVQIDGPVTSVYRWKGNVESATEYRCSIKTRAELYPAVEQAIKLHHAYETPEIVATPIVAGSAEYLAWIEAETGSR